MLYFLPMRPSNKGFTLIEILAAIAILAFTLTALLSIFSNNIFLNASNSNLSIATAHAQYALEDVKSTNFKSIASQAWNSATISGKGLTPLTSESITINVTGTAVLNVTATVNWVDRGGRNRNFALQTLISEP